jgi:hypothetical protein
MQDINARIVIKQGNGAPTIPVSLDPRNGDWLDTDIFEGEMYQDLDTGKVYTRDAVGITDATGVPSLTTYKVTARQTGTNDPQIGKTIVDDIAGVWSYDTVGTYLYTKVGAFTGVSTFTMFVQVVNNLGTASFCFVEKVSDDVISLKTYDNTGTLANGILNASILIQF